MAFPSTFDEVGEGATQLLFLDRNAFEKLYLDWILIYLDVLDIFNFGKLVFPLH